MPLFYNWNLGLRFDLQQKATSKVSASNDEYFDEVYHRANKLFESCFEKEDEIYLVVFSYKWRKQKIRKSNYILKLITNYHNTEFVFGKLLNRYEANEKWNTLLIKEKIKNIDIRNLIQGTCNSDFPSMKPSISEELYFVNIKKKLIFHIYDDRGLDILTSDKKVLKELYVEYDKWILDYEREMIEKQLND